MDPDARVVRKQRDQLWRGLVSFFAMFAVQKLLISLVAGMGESAVFLESPWAEHSF